MTTVTENTPPPHRSRNFTTQNENEELYRVSRALIASLVSVAITLEALGGFITLFASQITICYGNDCSRKTGIIAGLSFMALGCIFAGLTYFVNQERSVTSHRTLQT